MLYVLLGLIVLAFVLFFGGKPNFSDSLTGGQVVGVLCAAAAALMIVGMLLKAGWNIL